MFEDFNKSALFRLGVRVSAALSLLATIVWALWPKDWSNFDPSVVPVLIGTTLTWIGVEYIHFSLDLKPIEHPSDKMLARQINNRFPEDREYFYRAHSFAEAFRIEHLDSANFVSYFENEDKRRFLDNEVQSVFETFVEACSIFSDLVGERGGLFRQDFYIAMSDEEYRIRDDYARLSEQTRSHIVNVNAAARKVAEKRVELGTAFRRRLPSIFEELSISSS